MVSLKVQDVVEGGDVLIDDDTLHHFSKVLRLPVGEAVELLDGTGQGIRGIWERGCVANASPFTLENRLPPLVILQAMTKPQKLEEVVRRGTELGASEIYLFDAARSQGRQGLKEKDRGRLERVAADASRQSLRGTLPKLLGPFFFAEMLTTVEAFAGVSVAGIVSASQSLSTLLRQRESDLKKQGMQIAVGPEGGFTDEEAVQFLAAGGAGVRLGAHVMRTETAGPVALAAAQVVLGEL
ncbi:MAG: 16S rRNA (uracil(1498)-N(3))-methyltransferase [Deltaproteobacteria bacterium]|nr:16S rRNA (uracil(1498)-N(3))-methyltransferase [Deltaproteobacteria bacterium]